MTDPDTPPNTPSETPTKPDLTLPWLHMGLASIAILLLTQIIVGFLLAALLIGLNITLDSDTNSLVTISSLITYGIFFKWFQICNTRSQGLMFRRLGVFDPLPFETLFLLPFIVWIICTLLSGLLTNFLFDVESVKQATETQREQLSLAPSFSILYLFSAFAIVVAAPVIEEIIFRGMLLKAFLHRWGAMPALIITSLIFALIHFQFMLFPTLFLVGLGCGFVTLKTGSIKPAIVLHILNNAVVFFLLS